MKRSDLGSDAEHSLLERALDAAGLGEFEWDHSRGVLDVSDRMAAITGLPSGAIAAKNADALEVFFGKDNLDLLRTGFARSRETGGAFGVTFELARPDDGRLVWIRVAGILIRGDDDKTHCMTGIVEDVTQRRIEEDQRQTLMAELDHRVKNVLATVQALAIQTARRTASLEGFLQNFSGRLKAMGSANELLTAARWRGAAIDHLCGAELGAVAPGQTSWEGPELFLTPRAANALSLALHELATNAVKFGALSVETGRVNIRWTRLRDGGFELIWDETGGPTVNPPTRRGFGSTLLEQVTSRELNGRTSVEYRPAGVHAVLRSGPSAVAPRPDTVPEAPVARVVETLCTASGPVSLKGARVLIVEDAVLLALELETGLSEAGAEIVGPAYELEEAMALLSQPIDAAVLDANLNGRSVMPVAQALAARGVPFVFATGYGESGGAPSGFDAPVIRKPYDVSQVAAAVAQLLRAT